MIFLCEVIQPCMSHSILRCETVSVSITMFNSVGKTPGKRNVIISTLRAGMELLTDSHYANLFTAAAPVRNSIFHQTFLRTPA